MAGLREAPSIPLSRGAVRCRRPSDQAHGLRKGQGEGLASPSLLLLNSLLLARFCSRLAPHLASSPSSIRATFFCSVLPHPRRLDGLRGWREAHAAALAEDHGLEPVGHRWVHHRTVAVALDVVRQAVHLSEGHLADLAVARHGPAREAVQALPARRDVRRADEVDEGVAEGCFGLKLAWHVHKVDKLQQRHLVQQLQHHVAVVSVGHALEH
eukprot:CAMPEP_0115460928 /NCGR_PEP_ID=MMETSP0271-20121206/47043_2 /TAXON_ID=71861 /ORGANISM="Scrippsiella trochoidea, Strain CCMP3099" /LENGTH=211 /DNA_ID=CAMNT_0002887663 /DNA_START=37 /DNA_END=669 /DNA_ORIENTATION=-